jgi:hypothetical protein
VVVVVAAAAAAAHVFYRDRPVAKSPGGLCTAVDRCNVHRHARRAAQRCCFCLRSKFSTFFISVPAGYHLQEHVAHHRHTILLLLLLRLQGARAPPTPMGSAFTVKLGVNFYVHGTLVS